jgi:Flp pilus assembly pilin Flp
MRSLLKSFKTCGEKGQGVVEYAIALAVVVIVAAALANNPLEDKVNESFDNTAQTFEEIERI